mgnify:FL=1
MFIDTHCHLFKDYYEDMDNIICKIKNRGIIALINNGCDSKTNQEVLSLLDKYDFMYGAIGIHPDYADNYNEDDLKYIMDNIGVEKIVAIGEIGLDYHYDNFSKEKQITLFKAQLKMAEQNNLPVIIHMREATNDVLNTLKEYRVKGVIHCFTGSVETANILIKMGFFLGINGVVTFKNCNLINTIKEIGIDHIVLETDAPYLTPVPFRSEKNDSSHVVDTANFIANSLGIDVKKLADITTNNAKSLFDI